MQFSKQIILEIMNQEQLKLLIAFLALILRAISISNSSSIYNLHIEFLNCDFSLSASAN